MIDANTAGLMLLALSLVVTLINTVIIATTRAAVSELKANLIEKLASRADLEKLDARVRELELKIGGPQPWNSSKA